jgi:two-component system sensor histidine kinase DegS
MSVSVQNTAHRVVREALMNVYKHAGASEVMVSLTFAPTTLTVVAQDNGIGIPNDVCAEFRRPSEHFGLRTLAEQVEELGGELVVFNNVDESGATIKAFIPLVAASARAA